MTEYEQDDECNPIVTAALSQLILGHPWYATLALRLRVRKSDSIPTACVDGVTLTYNEKWLRSISPYQVKAVIAHEVMHCALLHMTRRGHRDPMLWSMAGDHVINLELTASGFKLPPDCVRDEKYRGMGTEQVYAILKKEQDEDVKSGRIKTITVYVDPLGGVRDAPKEKGSAGGKEGKKAGKSPGRLTPPVGEEEGAGGGKKSKKAGGRSAGDGVGGGDPDAAEGSDDGDGGGEDQGSGGVGRMARGDGGEVGDLEHDWEVAAASASMVAGKAGHLPSGADRAVRGASSTTDWRETLQKYLVVPGDFSWTRPNRRHISSGLYLPGQTIERPGRVVIAVDTSGSISRPMLEKFAGEAKYILDAAGWPESVYLIYCDAQVQGAREVEQGMGITFEDSKGGGGTYAQPVFDHVRELSEKGGQPQPVVMFYLTDLDLGDRPRDPGYPVVWVVPEWVRYQAGPFGEMVKVEMEGGQYGW